MIVNDYIETLPRNVETGLSFRSLDYPSLNIRMFEYSLVRGETHLVIPYCVSDSRHREYRAEELYPTFTTVFCLDEDKQLGGVQTWEKTTYAGEQVIDLGTFDVEGLHTLTVRTIQSNGIGSPTRLLKFFVNKPESEWNVVDLSTSDEFTGTFTNHHQPRMRFSSPYYRPCIEVYNCSYQVTKVMDGSDVSEIIIRITTPSGVDSMHTYRASDENGNLGDSVDAVTFDNEYRLVTKCTVGNQVHYLTEYLNTSYSTLPYAVIQAGANNKIALIRLFEAAKAAGADKLVLPKMDIVCDYHYTNVDRPIDGEGSEESKLDNRDPVLFPDNLTVDLNGSTVSMLPVYGNYKAKLFAIRYNTNTHLINGKLVGNWVGTEFSWTQDGEHRSIANIQAGNFCSLRNLDISNTVGYDVYVSSIEGATEDVGSEYGFDKFGYIDYDGVEQEDESASPNNNVYATGQTKKYGWMYTSQSCGVVSSNWVTAGPIFRFTRDGGNTWTNKSLTCHLVFVHFYDNSNNFIKTVKTEQHYPILVPYGAKRAKFTMWGTSILNDSNKDRINRSSSGGGIKSIFGYSTANTVPFICGIYDCKIHDTRMIVFANAGSQTVVKNCKLWNIAGERSNFSQYTLDKDHRLTPTTNYTVYTDYDAYSIYKHLIDIEDESRQCYHNWFDGFDFVYGDASSCPINAGNDYHIKNCHGLYLDLDGPIVDCLIENSCVKFHKSYSWVGDKCDLLVKNSILSSIDNGNNSDPGSSDYKITVRNCSVDSVSGASENKVTVSKNLKM